MKKNWFIVEYERQIFKDDFEKNYYEPGMSRREGKDVFVEIYSRHDNEDDAINEVKEQRLHSEVSITTCSNGVYYTVKEYYIQERTDDGNDKNCNKGIFYEYPNIVKEEGPIPLEESSEFNNVEFNGKKCIWPILKEHLKEIDGEIMDHIRFEYSPRSNQDYLNMFINEYEKKYQKNFVSEQ